MNLGFLEPITKPIKDFYNSETCAPIKNFVEDPKVQAIAIPILKALACIGIGAMLGAMTFAILPQVGMAAGIGIGAGLGLFAFGCVFSVVYVLKKYGYPCHNYCTVPSIPTEKWCSSDGKYKKFEAAFKELSPVWNRKITLSKDDCWTSCLKGLCQGEAQSLIALLKEHHNIEGKKLLEYLEPEGIFPRQLLEIARAESKNDSAIKKLAHDIPGTTRLKKICYTKTELQNNPRLLVELKEKLKKDNDYQAVAMTIRLQGKKYTPHTIFVEMHPRMRFYDSLNPIYTGMHEGFDTEELFLECLQRHILGYQSLLRPFVGFDEIIIRPYKIDHSDLEEKETVARVGAQPLI